MKSVASVAEYIENNDRWHGARSMGHGAWGMGQRVDGWERGRRGERETSLRVIKNFPLHFKRADREELIRWINLGRSQTEREGCLSEAKVGWLKT